MAPPAHQHALARMGPVHPPDFDLGIVPAAVEDVGLGDPVGGQHALCARSPALRGEWVAIIGEDGLIPVSDWGLSTRDGRPRAYRLSIPEVSGGRSETRLAAEVLHVVLAPDPAAPWSGTSPLRRASLSAGLLHTVETMLAEVYETAPIGSQVVPFPENPAVDSAQLGHSFRGQRGRVLLRESVTVTAAGGPVPATDWRPADLSPDISKILASETLSAARESVLAAYGVLPALFTAQAQGPLVREPPPADERCAEGYPCSPAATAGVPSSVPGVRQAPGRDAAPARPAARSAGRSFRQPKAPTVPRISDGRIPAPRTGNASPLR